MSRPPLLLSLLLTSSTLTACGDAEPAGDARFSTLTEARRQEVLDFALGTGAVLPFFATFGATAANAGDEACPAVTFDGAVTTYTADGCVNAGDGQRYDGRLIATNAFSLEDVLESNIDPAAPMTIEAEGWSAGDLELDGTLWQSKAQPADGQAYDGTVDYAGALGGRAIAYRGSSACAPGGTCTLDAFAETPDGTFALDGALSLTGERPRGWLVLRGVDELRLDLDAIDAEGCAPYTIGGRAAGRYCFELPEPEPVLEIWGGGTGCGSTDGAYELDVLAEVQGTPASVTVRVIEPATGIDETFTDLPELSYDVENDVHSFQLTVPEADTELARCAGRDYAYAITATTADGESVCASFGDHPELFPGCPAWL